MSIRAVEIQGQTFMAGKVQCVMCAKKFKFILPRVIMLFWEQLCGDCSENMPHHRPGPGSGYFGPMEWD